MAAMTDLRGGGRSDALVLFGITGDLAYQKIFPALQAMVRRKNLDGPVVGVARSGWTRGTLLERMRQSLEEHGGIDQAAFARFQDRSSTSTATTWTPARSSGSRPRCREPSGRCSTSRSRPTCSSR